MIYTKVNNKIIVKDLSQFNAQQIFDCGQIFRYVINKNVAEVISGNHYAQVLNFDDRVEIVCDNADYFTHFFDLERDYNVIKNHFKNDDFLAPSVQFGYGIRILNQNIFEMLVSFIISANNNISRIKKSLNKLSEQFGSLIIIDAMDYMAIEGGISQIEGNKLKFYAFPTLSQLKNATIQDYIEAGLGYRATYMYETIQKLTESDLIKFANLNAEQQYKFLIDLKGVGEKVAHCILLFATHNTNVFPVDTWINKVYNDLTNSTNTNRKEISKKLTDKYQNLSGYAQQYFFYYYRENKFHRISIKHN